MAVRELTVKRTKLFDVGETEAVVEPLPPSMSEPVVKFDAAMAISVYYLHQKFR